MLRDIEIAIITNFVVVSSVGIKRVDCTLFIQSNVSHRILSTIRKILSLSILRQIYVVKRAVSLFYLSICCCFFFSLHLYTQYLKRSSNILSRSLIMKCFLRQFYTFRGSRRAVVGFWLKNLHKYWLHA